MYIVCKMATIEGAWSPDGIVYTFYNGEPSEVVKRFAERDPGTEYGVFKLVQAGKSEFIKKYTITR